MTTKIKLLFGLLWLISSVYAVGQTPIDKTADRLGKVGMFAFGGVGFAGVTSQGEKDYRVIMARPSALENFEKILAADNFQAKAYALVAIRILDAKRYAELAAPFRKETHTITIMGGCVMSYVPFSVVVGRIDAGDYSDKR